MKLIFNEKKKRFEYLSSFENRNHAKAAGFMWDGELKTWYSHNLGDASKLRAHADEGAKVQLSSNFISVTPWSDAAPIPEGKELREFQKTAVNFILTRNRAYLAADPGLGKTIIAVAAVNADPGPVLYITPPFLKYNVQKEFSEWSTRVVDDLIVDAKKAEPLDFDLSDVVILPDSILHRPSILEQLNKMDFKWIFIDESHRFKTRDALRTMSLFGGSVVEVIDEKKVRKFYKELFRRSERVVAMSGTPTPNGQPVELFPVLHALAPETIGFRSFWEYARYFCSAHEGPFGWIMTGAAHVDELAKNLHDKFMLRIEKSKVLPELPPKTNQIIILDGKISKEIRALEGKNTWQDLMDKSCESGAEHRRLLGLSKVPEAAAYISDLITENREHVLVFAWHKDVIKELADKLEKHQPFVITGETDHETRNIYVRDYQSGIGSRLFIGNYGAMGVGYTLTKATRVIFVEYSYVPGENEQASDRAHRIGQTDNVLVQYLALKGSLDIKILESLLKKQKTITRLMEKKA